MDYNSFIDRIKAVEKKPLRYFIIDPELPLPLYFGLDSMGRPSLLVEDIGKVFSKADVPSTAQILVQSFSRNEKACLSFSLLTSEQRGVFNTLCYDLFESTRRESRMLAASSLLSRFDAWRELMKGSRSGVLTIPQQKGLAAELLALLYFSEKTDFSIAVEAWVGPLKMDKDFEFHDSWAEIKSCKVSATSVTISSIEQLDSSDHGRLFVYHIDQVPENKDGAFSLKNVVDRVRSAATNSASLRMLEIKLLLAQYVDSEPEYDVKRFWIYSRDIYKVDTSFPCLRREHICPEITACQYSLNLPAIENYKEDGE